jgi:hypothetical protein
MCSFLKRLFGGSAATPVHINQRPVVDSKMNEGDIHSGPHGYSPNTAYTETQYGSRFDEDADWGQEDH